MITKQMQVANKAHSWAHGKASPCSHPTCKFVRKATGHIDMRLTYPKLRLAAFNCLFLCKFARSKMSTQLKYNPQSAALRLINNFQYLCESTPLVFLKKKCCKWRPGAQSIPEPPLLAAKSKMETSDSYGWQILEKHSMHSAPPPRKGKKQAPVSGKKPPIPTKCQIPDNTRCKSLTCLNASQCIAYN